MKKSKFQPRGWRNNNPLNIRRSKSKWLGEVDCLTRYVTDKAGETCPTKEYDRTFCQFKEMKYGWRAVFKILTKYVRDYKLNTIRKIIGRWAPPNENHTDNYVAIVERYAGFSADTTVDIYDKDAMVDIVRGMCIVENGVDYDPFNFSTHVDDILEGYKIAMAHDS